MWWKWVLSFAIVFLNTVSSTAVEQTDNAVPLRQLNVGECCPCPPGVTPRSPFGDGITPLSNDGFSANDDTSTLNGDSSSLGHQARLGNDLEALPDSSQSARTVVEPPFEPRSSGACMCQQRMRAADSDGAASQVIVSKVHAVQHFLKEPEDPKHLLEPEVGLASSVLETIKEATDEEYLDAVARDAARSQDLLSDANPESNRNIVTVIMKPPPNSEPDVVPEETQNVEPRCITSLLRNSKLRATPVPGFDQDSDGLATNIQEISVDSPVNDHEINKLRVNPAINNLFFKDAIISEDNDQNIVKSTNKKFKNIADNLSSSVTNLILNGKSKSNTLKLPENHSDENNRISSSNSGDNILTKPINQVDKSMFKSKLYLDPKREPFSSFRSGGIFKDAEIRKESDLNNFDQSLDYSLVNRQVYNPKDSGSVRKSLLKSIVVNTPKPKKINEPKDKLIFRSSNLKFDEEQYFNLHKNFKTLPSISKKYLLMTRKVDPAVKKTCKNSDETSGNTSNQLEESKERDSSSEKETDSESNKLSSESQVDLKSSQEKSPSMQSLAAIDMPEEMEPTETKDFSTSDSKEMTATDESNQKESDSNENCSPETSSENLKKPVDVSGSEQSLEEDQKLSSKVSDSNTEASMNEKSIATQPIRNENNALNLNSDTIDNLSISNEERAISNIPNEKSAEPNDSEHSNLAQKVVTDPCRASSADMTPASSEPFMRSIIRPIDISNSRFRQQNIPLLEGFDSLFNRQALNELFDIKPPTLPDLPTLPTLDEIRTQIRDLLRQSPLTERFAEVDIDEPFSDEIINRNKQPTMFTDSSTKNEKLNKSNKNLILDIFQVKPLQQNNHTPLKEQNISPLFNLNSFRAKLRVPSENIKPIKLQSTLGDKNGLLGASLVLNPENLKRIRIPSVNPDELGLFKSPTQGNFNSLNEFSELEKLFTSHRSNVKFPDGVPIRTRLGQSSNILKSTKPDINLAKKRIDAVTNNLQESIATSLSEVRQKVGQVPTKEINSVSSRLSDLISESRAGVNKGLDTINSHKVSPIGKTISAKSRPTSKLALSRKSPTKETSNLTDNILRSSLNANSQRKLPILNNFKSTESVHSNKIRDSIRARLSPQKSNLKHTSLRNRVPPTLKMASSDLRSVTTKPKHAKLKSDLLRSKQIQKLTDLNDVGLSTYSQNALKPPSKFESNSKIKSVAPKPVKLPILRSRNLTPLSKEPLKASRQHNVLKTGMSSSSRNDFTNNKFKGQPLKESNLLDHKLRSVPQRGISRDSTLAQSAPLKMNIIKSRPINNNISKYQTIKGGRLPIQPKGALPDAKSISDLITRDEPKLRAPYKPILTKLMDSTKITIHPLNDKQVLERNKNSAVSLDQTDPVSDGKLKSASFKTSAIPSRASNLNKDILHTQQNVFLTPKNELSLATIPEKNVLHRSASDRGTKAFVEAERTVLPKLTLTDPLLSKLRDSARARTVKLPGYSNSEFKKKDTSDTILGASNTLRTSVDLPQEPVEPKVTYTCRMICTKD